MGTHKLDGINASLTLLSLLSIIALSWQTAAAGSNINTTGTIQGSVFYGAATGLTGTAAGLTTSIAQDLSCTDCIGTTEIADNYLLNTGDTASGNYTFDTNTLHIDSTNDRIGIGTTAPTNIIHANKSTDSGLAIVMQNPNSGSAATTGFNAIRDDGSLMSFGLGSTGFTTPAFRAATIYTNAAQGILLYTTSSQANITLSTNNAERMRITGDGNVSIGTTMSAASLTINSTNSAIYLIGSYSGDTSTINFRNNQSNTNTAYLAVNTAEFRIYHNDSNITIYPGGTEKVRFTSDGSVGIGTTAPGRLMHLVSSASTSTGLRIDSNGASGQNFSIVSTNSGSSLGGGRFVIWDEDNSAARLVINGTSGNVGIGTIDPGTMLTVSSANTGLGIESLGTAALGTSSGGGISLRTQDHPTAANQRLGGIFFGSRNDTFTTASAGIVGYSDEAFTSTARGAYLTFETVPIGDSTRIERLRITSNGSVGIGTTTPTHKLTVEGNMSVGGHIYLNSTNQYSIYGQGIYTNTRSMSFLALGNASNSRTILGSPSGIIMWTNTNNTWAGSSYGFYVWNGSAPSSLFTVETNGYVAVKILAAATANHICYDTTSISGMNTFATCSSLRALKTNITPLAISTETLIQLQPVSYNDKATGEPRYGFIAEDVNAIDPVLSTYERGNLTGVNYDAVAALLTKTVQDQQSEIEMLRAQNEALEARLDAIEATLGTD